MSYPKITSKQATSYDKYGNHNAIEVGKILSEFSNVDVSQKVVAGDSGATVTENFFITPEKMVVTKATFVMDKVQTGTDNTPTVSLYNLTKNVTIGITAAIPLSGTIGNTYNLVLDSSKVVCDKGDVLQVKIINPTATITVALEGKVQMEWNTIF